MSQPGWYVEVRLRVEGAVPERLTRLKDCSLWLGPMSWSGARRIAVAWEEEFGPDTAVTRDHPPRAKRLLMRVLDPNYEPTCVGGS